MDGDEGTPEPDTHLSPDQARKMLDGDLDGPLVVRDETESLGLVVGDDMQVGAPAQLGSPAAHEGADGCTAPGHPRLDVAHGVMVAGQLTSTTGLPLPAHRPALVSAAGDVISSPDPTSGVNLATMNLQD